MWIQGDCTALREPLPVAHRCGMHPSIDVFTVRASLIRHATCAVCVPSNGELYGSVTDVVHLPSSMESVAFMSPATTLLKATAPVDVKFLLQDSTLRGDSVQIVRAPGGDWSIARRGDISFAVCAGPTPHCLSGDCGCPS